MSGVYLYQNRLLPQEEVHISPEDRGYYFGDGIYEVFRVYNGRLYEADAHMRRLQKSAADVRIELPSEPEQLLHQLVELVAANRLTEGTVYLQITRGEASRSHPFPKAAAPVLMAFTNVLPRPLAAVQSGISIVSMDDIRWLRCDLKTLNLLPNVLAKQHALDRGAGDVVMHRGGTVTECSASNIMIVMGGRIVTHPANNLILHGITRAVVLRLANELEIAAEERPFTLSELMEADEVFITGTTAEITPVIAVDGATIGGGTSGPVTRKLQQAFERSIEAL
ncbi:D-amino-acid transaminase [Paenibacillus filicis]|uniref:D-alanine aminotransferase n=1 Tax=Paenibacillus gyeongsangnamensis TaxID=3388067 RepID=A0ABT4QBU5_9BACL|nr:D-amino-acid transaminase [Paenibacillus filicis]MCZ8514359.1 D-amino-acid transaminase [Paenibacillus filicis]